MDYEELIKDFANISADAALGKDLKKHHLMIVKNLTIIARHLTEFADYPDSDLNRQLMVIGYWFFLYRDEISKSQP